MAVNKKDQQNLDTWHGAEGKAEPPKRVGAPQSNLNPMTHGIWANQCLDDSERELFREIIDGSGTTSCSTRARTSCRWNWWRSTR